MTPLDLSADRTKSSRIHFRIRIAGKALAYCYIRKNGCTAFRHMILALSRHERLDGEEPHNFLRRCHRAKLGAVESSDYRICVLRDPVERTISLYKNKFIHQFEAVRILADYKEKTGQDPNGASFSDFVERYLALGTDTLDPHVRTQQSHLMPVHYNVVLRLNDLYFGMLPVVGQELADRFFLRKANASDAESIYHEDVSGQPASVLRQRLTANNAIPSAGGLCPPRLRNALIDLYANDYALLAAAGLS